MPVIRIDDEVMDELKKRAIALGLVFEPPNVTLRGILGLDGKDSIDQGPPEKPLEIELKNLYSPRRWALIPVPKKKRRFFPGYKVPFQLVTDIGDITTRVTSAPKGTPIGDPNGGVYIQGGLRKWYDNHPELKDGTKLRIEVLEPGKRYKLFIV
jgi:hypothetical protein